MSTNKNEATEKPISITKTQTEDHTGRSEGRGRAATKKSGRARVPSESKDAYLQASSGLTPMYKPIQWEHEKNSMNIGMTTSYYVNMYVPV